MKGINDTKDAVKVFGDALADMMTEEGYCEFSKAEQTTVIREVCDTELTKCWDEFVLWVIHGDDEKAKTRDIIKASLKRTRNSLWVQ